MFIASVLKSLLGSLLGNWKILIVALVIGVLSWKCYDLKIDNLELEKEIITLKNNEEKLKLALEDSQKSVLTLEGINNELSAQIEQSQQEINQAISTQRKLQRKINSLEKSEVKASPDNPHKPIEHYYFDQEMIDIINKDILRKK